MEAGLVIAWIALGLSLVVNIGGWLIVAGRMLERMKYQGERIADLADNTTAIENKIDKIFRYHSDHDRRIAVLEDRAGRVAAGD